MKILRSFAVLLVLSLLVGGALAAAPSVIIRSAAGQSGPGTLAAQLFAWREAGLVSKVLFLTDGRSEKSERAAKFGRCVILEFADEGACDIWMHDALWELPAGLRVSRADVLADGGAGAGALDWNRAELVVNTYTPLVSADRFADYVYGYVQPLYEAMGATGHLVHYTAYLERGEVGVVDALNVLVYRDADAREAMGRLKREIRARLLASNPTYAHYDAIKDTLRIDGFGTTAKLTDLQP
jgi:hypothetical protein